MSAVFKMEAVNIHAEIQKEDLYVPATKALFSMKTKNLVRNPNVISTWLKNQALYKLRAIQKNIRSKNNVFGGSQQRQVNSILAWSITHWIFEIVFEWSEDPLMMMNVFDLHWEKVRTGFLLIERSEFSHYLDNVFFCDLINADVWSGLEIVPN